MISRHAEARCQQRGIDREIVDILLRHGRRHYRRGASVCFMDKRARHAAMRVLGDARYRRVTDRLNVYLIVAADGTVITAAKRKKRLKFH